MRGEVFYKCIAGVAALLLLGAGCKSKGTTELVQIPGINKVATNPLPAPRSAMKIIECEGSPQSLGEQTGDLREEIREHISLRPMRDWPQWERRAPLFLDTLKTGLPRVLDEMLATVRAADVSEREILRLNLPLYPHRLTALSAASPSTAPTDAPAAAASAPGEGCTNFVFSDGPDGPVWGKNNDERRSKSSRRRNR